MEGESNRWSVHGEVFRVSGKMLTLGFNTIGKCIILKEADSSCLNGALLGFFYYPPSLTMS